MFRIISHSSTEDVLIPEPITLSTWIDDSLHVHQDDDGTFINSLLLPPLTSSLVLPVGSAYHNSLCCTISLNDPLRQSQQQEEGNVEQNIDVSSHCSKKSPIIDRGSTKILLTLSPEEYDCDWYALLGLKEHGEFATPADIKARYRQGCRETHPDKKASDHKDMSDKATTTTTTTISSSNSSTGKVIDKDDAGADFRSLQRAYEILSNPNLRRIYDSARPFDDSIPNEEEIKDDESFYKLFGKCFQRNGRFSLNQPVPDLGDAQTSLEELKGFYQFWLSFRSWRDFAHCIEVNEMDESMSREEKRWLMRNNQRQIASLRSTEMKRLRLLVDRARALDPRLLKHKHEAKERRQRQEEEREQIRQEKFLARCEAQKREQQLVETHKESKALNSREKAVKALVHRLTSQVECVSSVKTYALEFTAVHDMTLNWFTDNCTLREIESLLEQLKATGNDITAEQAVDLFNKALQQVEERRGQDRYGQQLSTKTQLSTTPKANIMEGPPWTEGDIVLLRKLLNKYPGGTVDRWGRISKELRKGKFDSQQVLQKAKEVIKAEQQARKAKDSQSTATTAVIVSNEDDWTVQQQRQFEQVLREMLNYTGRDKFKRIAAQVDGKTPKQCFERFQFLRAKVRAKI